MPDRATLARLQRIAPDKLAEARQRAKRKMMMRFRHRSTKASKVHVLVAERIL